MTVYSKELAIAAEWIWQHKDQPRYWEWQDLTSHNSAKDTLNMPDVMAWNIFTILQERNLMLPHEEHKDGKVIHAFKINLSSIDAWNKIRKPPSYLDAHLWSPLEKAGINLLTFSIWILTVIIASGLGSLINRLIDLVFPLPQRG